MDLLGEDAVTHITEFQLFQALKPFYPARQYALLPQVADGTGAGTFRHCDALALGLWPSRGIHLHGFEMKSYRGDWLRELKDPEKAESIAKHCNYWWIVAGDEQVVRKEELPQPWGLMVWDAKDESLRKVRSAPFHEAVAPDILFIAAILRKAQEVNTPDRVVEEARRQSHEQGVLEGQGRSKRALEDYAILKTRVREFEKRTRLRIDNWRPVEETISAVNQVLKGTVTSGRNALRQIANNILKDLGPKEPE